MSSEENHKDYYYTRITYDIKCMQIYDRHGHANRHPLFEQINHCEVNDRPLAHHCGTILIEESGPWST